MDSLPVSDLIGVPFVSRGRDARAGLDCYGLALELFRRAGIALPPYEIDAQDCTRIGDAMKSEEATGNWDRFDRLADAPVPSIVVIRFNTPALWNHVGVYIGCGRFAHTTERTGVIVERLDAVAWRHRIAGIYHPKGAARD